MNGESRRTWTVVAVLLLAGAGALRFWGLGDKPFWIAELQEFDFAYRPDFIGHLAFAAGDFPGYFYHSLCHGLGLAPHPVLVRGLAAFFGALLPPLVFWILASRRFFVEGVLAGLFCALSLPLLQASQEGRFYMGLFFFVSLSTLVHLLDRPGPDASRRWLFIGSLDALALASHPYAVVWIAVRWGAVLVRDRLGALPSLRSMVSWLLPVLLAFGLQVLQLALASSRFRELHRFFRLQPYPPDFPFVPELIGHLFTGTGVEAALFGALVIVGVYALGRRAPGLSWGLAATGLLGALGVLTAIWLAGARFGFVHMVPAAVPLYVLVAAGLAFLVRQAGTRRLALLASVLVILLGLGRMAWLDLRYLQRPTRLEMGADIRAMCDVLSARSGPGDVVVTTYDKYFSAFAWYCGPRLSPGVVVLADEIPEEPFALAFNHLAADGTEGPLPASRIHPLGVGAMPEGGRRLFVVVPYFEAIEGVYSETVGWYGQAGLYGPAVGPADAALRAWRVHAFPLINLLEKEVAPGEGKVGVYGATLQVLEAKRSWM